jgi:hypothetical protein
MDLKSPSRPLPDIELPAASGNGSQTLTARPRWSLVIVLLHGLDCESCVHFVQQLDEAHADLTAWDAEVAIVLKQISDNAAIPELAHSTRVLVDAEHTFESAAHVVAPAVQVVDQWRDVRESWEAGESHHFPAVSGIVSWARFLATQCPECEGESL